MSRNLWSSRLLIAALGSGLALSAMAWGPYGPGPWGGYPAPPVGMGAYGPGFPPFPMLADRSPYGNAFPDTPAPARDTGGTGTPAARQSSGDTPPDTSTPVPPYPGYGSYPHPFQGSPNLGRSGFGGPAGFRISRATTDDAYTLTIALDGMDPARVRIHTQGNRLILRRTHATQRTQKNDSGDGRGFTRSFSYSSGTISRRLTVPADAILSAMSREDGEDSIRLRIPRCGGQGMLTD